MKNPYENPILQELYEIRERMFEEAGGSLETLVKQLQARQNETIERRKTLKSKKSKPARRSPSTANETDRNSAR